MADVTVLGAGGSTVTITLTSAANAAAAQTALGTISDLVATKVLGQSVLEQFEYTGTGNVPATPGFLGGFVGTGAGDAGALTSQYISTVVNSAGNTTVIGAANPKATVVAGDGSNLTYFNQSDLANITLGVNNSFIIQGAGAGAIIAVDEANATGGTVVESREGSNTLIQAGDKSITVVYGRDSVGGDTGAGGNVNILAGAGTVVAGAVGSATVPVTVTGGAGTELQYLAIGGSALINPGAGNVTVFGDVVGTGTATVFGTTGSVFVVEGRGEFNGGDANDVMGTSTVAGSATLVGGGGDDVLFARGAGMQLQAGAGADTLSGQGFGVTGGSVYIGGLNTTIFGGGAGGNTYLFGGGLNTVDARETDTGAFANEFRITAGLPGNHVVIDFISGTDVLNISSAGLTLSSIEELPVGDGGNPFTGEIATRVTISDGTVILFSDTGKDGIFDFKATDIV